MIPFAMARDSQVPKWRAWHKKVLQLPDPNDDDDDDDDDKISPL